MTDTFLKSRGDVRGLKVYKLAVIISVATEFFVRNFLSRGTRTIDQMQQAARSCKQNIIEGAEAAKTSTETEIKLTNVARASLSELLEDYIDFLRFNTLLQWDKTHPRIVKMREFLKSTQFENGYVQLLPKLNGEEFCNLMITLIHQEMYLLDKLMVTQQCRFLTNGGVREHMTRARINYRSSQISQSNQNSPKYQKRKDS